MAGLPLDASGLAYFSVVEGKQAPCFDDTLYSTGSLYKVRMWSLVPPYTSRVMLFPSSQADYSLNPITSKRPTPPSFLLWALFELTVHCSSGIPRLSIATQSSPDKRVVLLPFLSFPCLALLCLSLSGWDTIKLLWVNE